MLAECPKFEGSPSEHTTRGTLRHEALEAYLGGNDKAFKDLTEEEAENMIWAAEYVKLKAPLLDHPLIVEQKISGVLPNGMPIEGTPDIICGDHLFDLKWRPRDYRAQMACYSYMIMDGRTVDGGEIRPITAHVMYAQTQTVRIMKFDPDTAWMTIKPIIEHSTASFSVATPCSFCGWCAKKLTCEALVQQVNIALQSNPEWNLPQWHSSEMKTAKEMGLALKIARTLSDWCDSVEFHAKELAVKQGIVAEGFSLSSKQGNRFVDDIGSAFQKSGLPQEVFLKACDVRPATLFNLYAEFHGMKKAHAEREIEKRLGETIKRKNPSVQLTVEKPKKD
jgi:hypothetical protein